MNKPLLGRLRGVLLSGSSDSARRPWIWALWGFCVGGIVTTAGYIVLVLRQTSSTAAIGLLGTPVVAAAGALGTAAWTWALARVLAGVSRKQRGARHALGILVWLGAATFLVWSSWTALGVVGRVVRLAQIRDPDASPAALEAAYERARAEGDLLLLAAVAENPRVPPRVLLELARSSDPRLHEKRGGLLQLLDDDALAVVRKVVRNPSAPAEVVPLLARSSNDYVLGDVAGDPRASTELLREIDRRSDSYLVDWGLARNPHTPPEVLARVARDQGLEPDYLVADDLAGNPSTPRDLLERLARHPSRRVRYRAAGNPALDPELLVELADDPEPTVRIAVARNPSTPDPLVERLLEDPDESVRRYARWTVSERQR